MTERTFCGKLLPYGTGTRCIFQRGHDGKCAGPRVLSVNVVDDQREGE